jgi:ferredoxin
MFVFIEPGCCWGRIIGEDAGNSACELCVQICPSVFEKPAANRCARVRLKVDPSRFAAQVRRAARACPVSAIRMIIPGRQNT